MKRYLPKPFKQFLWFVFKSPPRHWLGMKTLWTDIKGYLTVLLTHKIYYRVTVCVGVKNRSQNLLEHLIESMKHVECKLMINLCVFDCGSTDIENLHDAIIEKWPGAFSYRKIETPFTRAHAFNAAVKQSPGEVVLVCDADMSLPRDIITKVSRYTTKRSAWFPIVWYTNKDGSGRYYTESTGMMSCFKKDFLKVGGFDESIKEWGKEDWLLYFEFYKHDMACIRTKEKDFVHHYHDSLKPEGFVPLF